MPKIIKRKFKFHWTHLFAVAILGSYFVLSKVNMVHALSRGGIVESFSQLYFFGVFFACSFLYIFSHEKFFPFAKDMEEKQKKKEKEYLRKYLHHGKVFGIFLIGAIGGPVFSSLTARMLLNNFWYKYLIVLLANIPSTIITVGIGKGVIHFF